MVCSLLSAARVTSPVKANGRAVRTSTLPVEAVARPRIESVATVAILAKVTALSAIVALKDPVPEPVTSPANVIVWSPVLVPVDVPVCVPESVAAPETVRLPASDSVLLALFMFRDSVTSCVRFSASVIVR